MTVLIIGLLLFFGVHSVRMLADPWRTAQIARLGAGGWKGLYSLASAVGLGLMIWGYALARRAPVDLWQPPAWTFSAAALLTAISFVLIAAAYVPGNHFKVKLGHPLLAGTKLWAFAHLISNGRLADLLLFGVFLVWAVFAFTSARRRDRAEGKQYRPGTLARDMATVAVGLAAWVGFAFFLHAWLIGVAPLPG
jgi:uncharacterized membrane protein